MRTVDETPQQTHYVGDDCPGGHAEITVPSTAGQLTYPVLDRGFVRVVDTMGTDASIVQAARVSYGKGTKTAREDAKLIAYLMRNGHLSPFEMAELKVHVKAPIFVARQWVRHRTASWNEVSARYSEMPAEFYIPAPEAIAAQSTSNKQGRGETLSEEVGKAAAGDIERASRMAFAYYEGLLRMGVARELARMVLPVNLYTEWYWKIDLRNLLHFIELRTDAHAQYEIRQYACVLEEIVSKWVPATYEAFRHRNLGA